MDFRESQLDEGIGIAESNGTVGGTIIRRDLKVG
jgi:hypothetical protein